MDQAVTVSEELKTSEHENVADSSNAHWLGSYIEKGVGEDQIIEEEENDSSARYVQKLVEFYTDKPKGERQVTIEIEHASES